MAQERIQIEVNSRMPGKHVSRTLRQQKVIPGVVYGSKVGTANVSLEEKVVEKFFDHIHENIIYVLKSENTDVDGTEVLVKDIAVHPATQRPVHVDFYAPQMDKVVRVHVELKFEGQAKGVKEDDGVIQFVTREVEVECLPNTIPEAIPVDIRNMAINESLHVSDIAFPEGVKAMTPSDKTIVTCTQKVEEKEPEETVVEAAPEAAPEPQKS